MTLIPFDIFYRLYYVHTKIAAFEESHESRFAVRKIFLSNYFFLSLNESKKCSRKEKKIPRFLNVCIARYQKNRATFFPLFDFDSHEKKNMIFWFLAIQLDLFLNSKRRPEKSFFQVSFFPLSGVKAANFFKDFSPRLALLSFTSEEVCVYHKADSHLLPCVLPSFKGHPSNTQSNRTNNEKSSPSRNLKIWKKRKISIEPMNYGRGRHHLLHQSLSSSSPSDRILKFEGKYFTHSIRGVSSVIFSDCNFVKGDI